MGAQVKRRDRSHWHWVTQFSVGLAIGIAILCGALALLSRCVHQDTGRIDWSKVPVATGNSPRITENQRVFARERKRQYAALAFERTR